jgi:YtxH-like protein
MARRLRWLPDLTPALAHAGHDEGSAFAGLDRGAAWGARKPQGASTMYIKDWFLDVVPFKRKSSADWIVPAVLGLGLGLAAGVGLGLLVAPSTGEEVRLRLRERASRVKEKAANLADKARSQVSSAADQMQRQIDRS